MLESAGVIDCGVDYLTVTTPELGIATVDFYEYLKRVHIREDWGGQAGVIETDWAWQAYSGKTVGKLTWGSRNDGSIIRVSGSGAKTLARISMLQFWRASRIDLQATIRIPPGEDVDTVIGNAFRAVAMKRAGVEGRPYKIRLIDGAGDGDTMNIGSRSSEAFVRVYNKAKESNEPEYTNCVRVELEAKGKLARRIWADIPGGSQQDKYALELLLATDEKYGIGIIPKVGSELRRLPHIERAKTTLERRLEWLRVAVQPTVKELTAAGWREDVMRALGIDAETGLPVDVQGRLL